MLCSDSLSASRGGSGRDPINTFAVMEDVNDKLKLLNYEDAILKKRTDLKPLSRTYFALPGKPSEQFPYFAQIAVWALQQIGVDMEWSEWVRTGGGRTRMHACMQRDGGLQSGQVLGRPCHYCSLTIFCKICSADPLCSTRTHTYTLSLFLSATGRSHCHDRVDLRAVAAAAVSLPA